MKGSVGLSGLNPSFHGCATASDRELRNSGGNQNMHRSSCENVLNFKLNEILRKSLQKFYECSFCFVGQRIDEIQKASFTIPEARRAT